MNRTDEIMTILQEECAELIQALSKIKRFGEETNHNRAKLIQELGDVQLMIGHVITEFDITEESVYGAMAEKERKLKVYSSIYNDE